MKHVMVDLETLDSSSTAAVVSIGAVFFNPETGELGSEFKANIRFSSAAKFGTISGDTLEWWFQQTDEVRAHLNDPAPISLPDALDKFTDFMQGDLFVWGNGATFDNVILRNAYVRAGKTAPWNFRRDMCFRTLKNQFDPTSKFYTASRVGVAHDSLSDAISQARHANAIFEFLKGGGVY